MRKGFVAFVAYTTLSTAWAQGTADGRFSVSAEALFSWFKSSPTPVPIIVEDYVPGANVLLGGGSVDTNVNPGLRLTGSYRIDSRWGVEVTGFYIPSRSTTSSVSSSGQPGSIDLLLPFFDATLGQESFTEISYSPEYRGAASVTFDNNLGGAEVNATWSLPRQGAWKMDLIGGLRFLQLRESYTITTTSPYIPPYPADVWNTSDAFDARNRFLGVQIGARAVYDDGPWTGGVTGKIALGSMTQKVSISGFLETNEFNNYGAPQTFTGGYFALPSNSGTHSQSEFAVVPEIGLNLGYRVTRNATVFVAYSFLYASNVVRPGEQVNRNINPTQSLAYGGEPPATPVGPREPSFSFSTTDFWAQTLSIGFAWRF